MRTQIQAVAVMQLALILPAALFLTAVLVGVGDPPQYDLARLAQGVVTWYSARMWTLWLLLLAFPFAVLVTGCATLAQSFNRGLAPFATLCVAGTTFSSVGILAVVVLHMLAN